MLPSLTGLTLGKYRITERLGQGENAVVYKAFDLGLDLPVTIKVPTPGNPVAHDRLQRESVTLAQFPHANIRQVRTIETFGGYFFAVLDYAERSLRSLMAERFEQRRVFSRAETVRLLRPIADVLDYLHGRGWVHLDVKPENIMIADDGRIMLADFGIAQRLGKAQNKGTPGYASPEALRKEAVGPAADLFSLAAVVYEMLAGRPPFVGDVVAVEWQTANRAPEMLDRANRRCSNSLAFVVRHAMAKDPRQRFPASAGAFLDRLERADTVTVRVPTLPRRRPVLVSSCGGVVVVAAILLGTRLWQPYLPTPAPSPAPAPPPITAPAIPSPTLSPMGPTTGPPTKEVVAISPTTSPITIVSTATIAPTPTPRPTITPVPPGKLSPTPAPTGAACTNDGWVAGAVITEPRAGATLQRGPVAVRGAADLPNMTEYELYIHGPGQKPDDFAWRDSSVAKVKDGRLWTWDTAKLTAGQYLLRLRVKLNTGNYKDCVVPVTLE